MTQNLTRRSVIAGALLSPLVAEAAAQPRSSLRVAHLTDMHVMPQRDAPRGMERSLIACQEHKPDLILVGGDMIWDSLDSSREQALEQWKLYKSILRANTSLRVEATLGNHDVWGWGDVARYGSAPEYGKKLALDQLEMAKSYRSFDVRGWHFVILDSTYPAPGNGYVAKLDDEQFSWLEADLARTPKTTPILISTHAPILSAAAFLHGEFERSGQWQLPAIMMHLDARKLKTLFLQHPNVKLCISGHVHLVDRVDYLGVSYICAGAVSGGWWLGPHQEIGNGYSIIDLLPDGTFAYKYVQFPWTPRT